jgi:hypothetical protein
MLYRIARSIRRKLARPVKPLSTSSEIRTECDENSGLCRYFKVDQSVYSSFNKTITSFRTIFVPPDVPFQEAARQSLASERLSGKEPTSRTGLMSHQMLYDDEKQTRISINIYDYPDSSSYFTLCEYPNPEKDRRL